VRETCAADHLPLPDIARLRGDLAQAQQRGYVVNVDFQPGRVSVAAPVINIQHVVLGGVSVAGPVNLFDAAIVEQAAADIVAVAAAVGERIGLRG
jgi:DNA-binding IclR family transcriptional regulator